MATRKKRRPPAPSLVTGTVRVYRRSAGHRYYPELRISGRYLEQLGLGYGDEVTVTPNTVQGHIVVAPVRKGRR